MWQSGLIFLVGVTSPWWWQVARVNLVLAFMLLVTAVLGMHKRAKIVFLVLFVAIAFGVTFGFGVERYAGEDPVTRNSRWRLYPIGQFEIAGVDVPQKIAVWSEVRIEGQYAKWFLERIALTSDPNYYFFGNHPHERVGVVESQRFYWWLIPFAAMGILVMTKNRFFLMMFATSILISVFAVEGTIGFVLLFPFWCVFISQGILLVLEAIKRKWTK